MALSRKISRMVLKTFGIGIAVAILVPSFIALVITVLSYRRIIEYTPMPRPRPGTIVDNYEGIWAHSIDECKKNHSKNRTLINTTGDYNRFSNYWLQCDLINLPKNGDPNGEISLGCWKAQDRSIGDHGGKSVYALVVINRDTIMIGPDLFTRCERQ